jgi:general secretion pathway protein H
MRQRGFTLVEILVTVVIIGIMITVVTLSGGLAFSDRELETERDRILAIADHLRDQAALQIREYGLRCFDGGYQFLVWDAGTGLWTDLGDDLLIAHELPEGLEMRLWIEGRRVVLPEEEVDPDDLAPQILLYSSGELSLFELQLWREQGGAGERIAPTAEGDEIVAVSLEAEQR